MHRASSLFDLLYLRNRHYQILLWLGCILVGVREWGDGEWGWERGLGREVVSYLSCFGYRAKIVTPVMMLVMI